MVDKRGFFYGPSDWFRTSGLVVPNHALYHLSYTRIFSFFVFSAVVVNHVVKRRFSEFLRRSKSAKTPVFTRGCGICIFRSAEGVLHAPKPGAIPNFAKPGSSSVAFGTVFECFRVRDSPPGTKLIIYDLCGNCNTNFSAEKSSWQNFFKRFHALLRRTSQGAAATDRQGDDAAPAMLLQTRRPTCFGRPAEFRSVHASRAAPHAEIVRCCPVFLQNLPKESGNPAGRLAHCIIPAATGPRRAFHRPFS